jgi:uncharacterized protein (DUF4415 family)
MGKIVRYTSEVVKKRKSQSDWDRAARMTDEEIEAADRDDPEMDGINEDWMDNATTERTRKRAIYAKFDEDVIEYFQSFGRGYQARMNAVLRAYMEAHRNDKA